MSFVSLHLYCSLCLLVSDFKFPNNFVETVEDFAEVDASNTISLQYDFGPGTALEGSGTMVFFGSEPSGGGGQRRLTVDAFYVAPPSAVVIIGASCPLAGSELLPPDETFPFTLFVLGGEQDRVVYACEAGLVVGIAQFDYVGTQAPQFTPFPTVVRVADLEDGTIFFYFASHSHFFPST